MISFSTDVEFNGDEDDDVEDDTEDDLDFGAEVMVVLVRCGTGHKRRATTRAGLYLGTDGDTYRGLSKGVDGAMDKPGLKNVGVVSGEINRQEGILRVCGSSIIFWRRYE